jgi:hypothetical protein
MVLHVWFSSNSPSAPNSSTIFDMVLYFRFY